MPSLRSRLALFLSLMLLVGLAGCGPASSDNAPNLGPRATVGGPAAGGTGQGEKAFTPLVASGDGIGPASRRGTMQGGDNTGQGDKLSKPAGMPNVEIDGENKMSVLGIPDSIAKGLDSPDPRERLQAMNHWETKGTKAPLDPVFEAMEDEDEAVRAKATEIIERYWEAEQEQKRN